MKKIILWIVVLALWPGSSLFAQADGQPSPAEVVRLGSITIIRDARIADISKRKVTLNKRKGGIDGYRIQIFFNSGRQAREEAIRVKADFLSLFHDMPVYIVYRAPFYKVRIGNFRSKYEALGVFPQIRKKYSNAYIVKDVIPFPELD